MENSTEDSFWLPEMFPCPYSAVCIIEFVVVVAVVFLSITGNVVNLGVLLSTPSLRNCHGYLLMSLSAADFITGLVLTLSIYPAATLESVPGSWPYGDSVCLLAAYVTQIGITNSGNSLALLSIERYIAVAHPLHYTRVVTKRVTLTCIGVVWAVPVLVCSTIFAGIPKHIYESTFYVCLPMVFGMRSTLLWILLLAIVTVTLIIVVTSCIVSRKLLPRSETNQITSESTTSRTKRKLKTFRMVQVMTAAFILSYAPYFSVALITSTAGISMPQVVDFGVFWLLAANSFFNVIVYFTMNTTFQKRIHQITDSLVAVISCKSAGAADIDGPSSSRMYIIDSNRLNNDRNNASNGPLNTGENMTDKDSKPQTATSHGGSNNHSQHRV